jgi:hypothetical protein
MLPFLRFLERRLLAVTASVCLFGVTAALIWLMLTLPQRIDGRLQANLVDASWNLRDASWQLAQAGRNVRTVSAALADPRRGLARTLRNVNTVTAQIGRASNVARLASSEQRDSLRTISQETLATLQAANSLLDGANQNLNHGVLPSLTADLGQVQASLTSLTSDSHRMLASSTTAIDRAATLVTSAALPDTWTVPRLIRSRLSATSATCSSRPSRGSGRRWEKRLSAMRPALWRGRW